MSRKIKILATFLVVIILIIEGLFSAEDTFRTSFGSTSLGLDGIGEGVFPFSLSWSKTKDLSILSEDDYDKAHLVFSFGSSVARDRDYGFDPKTGAPSWLGAIPKGQGKNTDYYYLSLIHI